MLVPWASHLLHSFSVVFGWVLPEADFEIKIGTLKNEFLRLDWRFLIEIRRI